MNENIAYLVDDVLVAAGYKLRNDDAWDELHDRLLAVLGAHYEVDLDAVGGDDSYQPDSDGAEDDSDSDSIALSSTDEELPGFSSDEA